MTGCVLGWSLGSTLIRPEIERPVCRLKRWWVSGVITLVTLGLWGGLRVAEADLPEELWWIALGAAFGPAVIFAFVYVRLDSNALYHRLVRDAFLLGEPGPTELEAE